ncbi:hypothetical protein DSC45_13220 [Streptomyces sp. YIM 130001]|uniref:DUF397 domain-containing protein n=1 Tax=Streptomyces sp. YIM 130001 TaxID=2259644 RepID=UPI000E6505AC|nr:DUF397 domain-containing protein [Streptomyces sp. YIM 130001]RII17858.1 hypothetical protein DSC45_13220 [Streptomyces sp. YIM 130001]
MTDQRAVPAVPETAWIKSSYSSGGGGECVEVADAQDTVRIRDSKNAAGPVLALSHAAWAGLVRLAVTDRTV